MGLQSPSMRPSSALIHCSSLGPSVCVGMSYLAILEKILSDTTGLSNLSDESDPAPQESGSPHGALHLGRLVQLQDKLIEIMWDLGHARSIWLSSSLCPHWEIRYLIPRSPFCTTVTVLLAGCICQSLLLVTCKLKSRQ